MWRLFTSGVGISLNIKQGMLNVLNYSYWFFFIIFNIKKWHNTSFWSRDQKIVGQTGLVCGLVSSKHTRCVLVIRLQQDWRQLTRRWAYPCDTLGTRTQPEQWHSQDRKTNNLNAVGSAVCNIGVRQTFLIIKMITAFQLPTIVYSVSSSSHPSLLPTIHPPSRWVSPPLHTFPHTPVVPLHLASPQVCLIVLFSQILTVIIRLLCPSMM